MPVATILMGTELQNMCAEKPTAFNAVLLERNFFRKSLYNSH